MPSRRSFLQSVAAAASATAAPAHATDADADTKSTAADDAPATDAPTIEGPSQILIGHIGSGKSWDQWERLAILRQLNDDPIPPSPADKLGHIAEDATAHGDTPLNEIDHEAYWAQQKRSMTVQPFGHQWNTTEW